MVNISRGRTNDGRAVIIVRSPYHPDFPPRARDLGGKWNPRAEWWWFDARDEAAVRRLLVEIYGTDGTPTETVDVTVSLDAFQLGRSNQFWLLGRLLVSRPARDARVQLGDGVRILSGGFAASGGSRQYPELAPHPGTVLLVRDVPRPLYEQLAGQGVGLYVEQSKASGTTDIPEAFREALKDI